MKKTIITLIAAALCGVANLWAKPEQPNIILLLADDLGWADLGFQGSSDIRSPNIDQLAKNGIRFTDGHVSASVCSPSRAGLMTGRYQQRFGHEANSPPPSDGMDIKQITLADRLKKLGYRTGLIGKWHLGNRDEFYPTRRGFDYFYGLRSGSRSYFYNARKDDKTGNSKAIEENGKVVKFDGYLTDVFGQKAIDFINAKDGKPFFLFHSFTAPHGPMHATEEDKKLFVSIKDPKRRTYAAMIWAMDRAIGQLIDSLKASGKFENTLIWFLSDNGGATGNASVNLPLAGHKGIKFEGGTRVPFFAHWPKQFKEPQKFDPMMISLDIMPTSLAAAGAKEEDLKNLDGVNLLPFIRGEKATPPHQDLYWHKIWFSAMRDGPWKLIYVQDYGYALYNLDKDLPESKNLIKSEKKRAEKMISQLNDWKSGLEKPRWKEAEVWFRTHSRNHVRIIEGK
ncbi:MAG: sulfatase-like hydrolase/transferase [Opitutae bacterium]|jgi:arylsulfatase A-like enzyme|nr:sulfatase-like hydrolase/transferase [Opitutae bacterium]